MDNKELPTKPIIPPWEHKLLSVVWLCIFAINMYILIERGNYRWNQWGVVIMTLMPVPNYVYFRCPLGRTAGKVMRIVVFGWLAFLIVYFLCMYVWGLRQL